MVLVGGLLGPAAVVALLLAIAGRPEWSFGGALIGVMGASLLLARLRTDRVTDAGRQLVAGARQRVTADDPRSRPEAVALGLVDPRSLGVTSAVRHRATGRAIRSV